MGTKNVVTEEEAWLREDMATTIRNSRIGKKERRAWRGGGLIACYI